MPKIGKSKIRFVDKIRTAPLDQNIVPIIRPDGLIIGTMF